MKITTNLKTYENVNLVTRDGVKYIKKAISAPEKDFYQIIEDKYPQLENIILIPEIVEQQNAYFRFIEEGQVDKHDGKTFRLIMENVALLHSQLAAKDFSFLNRRPSYVREFTVLMELVKSVNFEEKEEVIQIIEFISKSTEIIELNNVIHDDLIPLNILKNTNKIFITDWEYVKIDFAERDIGRLLGDLYFENYSFSNRYYNYAIHDELVDIYLTARKKFDPKYDKELGKFRVYLSELINYLGPIEACIKLGELDRWFFANVEALVKTYELSAINKLKNKI